MSECGENCHNECVSVRVQPDDAEELKQFVDLVVQAVGDYRQGISGIKRRATMARKKLMEIKKLTLIMRKMALEKCRAAREAQ